MTRQDWINELLHRITVAESRAARMYLCAELKREIAALLELPNAKDRQEGCDRDVLRRVVELGAYPKDF